MFERLSRFAPQVLGVTRVFVGISLASHGAQKVLGWFGGVPEGVPAFVVWGAGSIELVGGALLAVGLFSRPVAFLSSGLMAFAYFLGHAGRGLLPIANGGELAVVYSWLTLYLAAQGPGAWALDGLRTPRVADRSVDGRPALRAA